MLHAAKYLVVAITFISFLSALLFGATDAPGTMSIEFARFSGLGLLGLVACLTMGIIRTYRLDRHNWSHFGLRLAICSAFLIAISLLGFRLVMWPELAINQDKYKPVRRF